MQVQVKPLTSAGLLVWSSSTLRVVVVLFIVIVDAGRVSVDGTRNKGVSGGVCISLSAGALTCAPLSLIFKMVAGLEKYSKQCDL